MSDKYEQGYRHGFRDGFKAAVADFEMLRLENIGKEIVKNE